MSPNEGQLRAALHEGEGDNLDAGALISHAVGVRRERRRRVYLAAGTAAAVAVIGVGVAALTNTGGHHNGTSADKAGGAVSAHARPSAAAPKAVPAPNGAAATGGRSPAGGGHMSQAVTGDSVPAGCPQTAARYMLPGGGGSGQFGASEPLFTRNVAKIVVCGYPERASESPRRLVVKDGEATGLATSLESAPAAYQFRKCESGQNSPPGTLELLATDATGKSAKPVVVTVGCPKIMATNGTAVRYLNSLPRRFLDLLSTTNTASPVR